MMKKQIQKLNKGEAVTGYLFILPQMIGLMIFVIIPLVMIITYSFQNRNFLFGNLGFCGLENYRMLIDDEIFLMTLKNTLIFSLGVVPLNLVLSLALAMFLAGTAGGTSVVRGVIFLPVITSGVAWSIVFKFLLQGGPTGPINSILSIFGIEGPNWLFEKGWAMFSVVVARVLKNLGMNVLIFMGAVMNLPQDVIEAGKIDGAGRMKLFSKIKLPMLMPSILMVMIVTLIGSMRVFDTIKLMTDGGPEGSTMVLVYYIYHQAFKSFSIGYASTIAVVLFVIVLILTIFQWSLRKKADYYEN